MPFVEWSQQVGMLRLVLLNGKGGPWSQWEAHLIWGGGGRGPEYMEALDGVQVRTIFKVANILSRLEDLHCLLVSYPDVSLMCRQKETIGPFG